jgi:hypothetical protein
LDVEIEPSECSESWVVEGVDVPNEVRSQLASWEFNNDDCDYFVKLFVRKFNTFISKFFSGAGSPYSVRVYKACRSKKLSFHVVSSVVVDSHLTSCVFLAWEFSQRFHRYLLGRLREPGTWTREKILCLLALRLDKRSPGCVDLAPYGKNQLFRLLGSGKDGKYPLRLWSGEERECYIYPLGDYDFASANPVYKDWVNGLVVCMDPTAEVMSVSPGACPLKTARSRYFMAAAREEDCAVPSYRVPAVDPTLLNSEQARDNEERGRWASNSGEKSLIAEDTFMWHLQDGSSKAFGDLQVGEYVYHQECESTHGTPSGCVFSTRDQNLKVHCFACGRSVYCLPTFTPLKIMYKDEDVVKFAPGQRFINEKGFPATVDLASLSQKWVTVDAPTGSGKTELLESFLASLAPGTRVLSISPRIAMARTAAERFGYHFYQDELPDGGNADLLACTLDHLAVLGTCTRYDVIILDECGMTKDHTISSTISPRLDAVLKALGFLLENAQNVFLTQHQLLERDVTFFMGFTGDDLYNSDVTKRVFVDTPLKLHPIQYTGSLVTALTRLVEQFRKKKQDGRAQEPVLVVTTSVSLCRAVTALLKECTQYPEKIHSLYGDNQHTEFNKRFMEDPNSDYVEENCDAMVMTHCSPAGLSIIGHFTMLVLLYPLSFVTHRTEYQFSRRLRLRPGLFPYIIAFIQKGISNSGDPNIKKMTKNMQVILSKHRDRSVSFVNEHTLNVFVENRAEILDTRNRHQHLWKTLYLLSQGQMTEMGEVVDDAELTYVKDTLVANLKSLGKGVKAYITLAETIEDEVLQRDVDANTSEMQILGTRSSEILRDYIKGPDKELFVEWFRDSVPDENALLPNKIREHLGRSLHLISFMDYIAFLHHNDSPCSMYHTSRLRRTNTPQTVGGKSKLLISTKILLYLVPGFSRFKDDPLVSWNTPSLELVKEYISTNSNWTDAEDAHFKTLFNQSRYQKANSIKKPASFLNTCLRNVGLQTVLSNKRTRTSTQGFKIDMDALAYTLRIAKGMIYVDHWAAITESYDQPAWHSLLNNSETLALSLQ